MLAPIKSLLILSAGIILGFSFAFIWMSAFPWMNTISNVLGRYNFDKMYYKVDRSVATDLSDKVRILCWIITNPDHHHLSRARRIKESWGGRCNVLLFVSSEEDNSLPAIAVESEELWPVTREALAHVYKHYIDSADWFLRADDETYVIVENLRYMLHSHSPDEPVYFGRKFLKHVEQGYMSGGAGYVLSREALRRFIEVGLPDPEICNPGVGLDDVELGKCLENVGVAAGDSRDNLGRERFFPFQPEVHMSPGFLKEMPWYLEYINASKAEDVDCCSDSTITFHYIDPDLMLVYDYLLYGLRSL